MGKTRKQRMRKKFQYSQNRKRAWKKSKKLPVIKSAGIQSYWTDGKSIEANLTSMGLVADPNKMFKIESNTVVEIGTLKRGADGKMEVDTDKPIQSVNIHVREDMEAAAKIPRKKSIAMSKPVAEIIGYLLATYGDPDDPEVLASNKSEKSILTAMAKDKRNYDQLTPKQIKRKILAFKRVPEYVEEYCKNKM